MGLSPKMMATLARIGYEKPSPVQAGVIPLAMQEFDVIGQARTGTGKTAAFAIPILEQLDLSVSALGGPKPGDPGWDAYVAQNVNRWRGQIGLDKSDDKWSGGESFEVASADGQAVFVDIVGEPGSGGPSGNMMGNMAAGGSTPPFMRQAKSGESGVSPTEESASNAPESDPSSSGGLKAEAPEDSGWRRGLPEPLYGIEP